MKNIISKLNTINGVTETHSTFSLYVIFAKVEADNEEGIQKIVTEKEVNTMNPDQLI
jgi:copper chaperone CopZ